MWHTSLELASYQGSLEGADIQGSDYNAQERPGGFKPPIHIQLQLSAHVGGSGDGSGNQIPATHMEKPD